VGYVSEVDDGNAPGRGSAMGRRWSTNREGTADGSHDNQEKQQQTTLAEGDFRAVSHQKVGLSSAVSPYAACPERVLRVLGSLCITLSWPR